MGTCRRIAALVVMIASAHVVFSAEQAVGVATFASAVVRRAGDVSEKLPADVVFYRRKVSLRQLIDWAYDTTRARTVGGVDWMDDLSWQVIGTSRRANPRDADVKAMARRLLEDRFKLGAEVQTQPMSALVISFDPVVERPSIRRATASVDCQPFLNGDKAMVDVPQDRQGNPLCGPSRGEHVNEAPVYHFRSAPLTSVARELEIILQRVVVWTPPAEGLFDVDLRAPESYSNAARAADVDSFMDALEAQWGVQVAVRTVPARVVVIRSAAKPTLDGR